MTDKPRVTASAEIHAYTLRRECDPFGHTSPGVEVSVAFDLHDHVAALESLEAAVLDVRAQIAEVTK